MTLVELQFFLIITYFSYVAAVFIFHSKIKKLYFVFATIFILCAFVLRFNVSLKVNADFDVYNSYLFFNYKFSWDKILSEPFLPLLFQAIKKYISANGALPLIYLLNFCSTAIFYVWVGSREDIKPWIKISLFSFTYILFTYTVLRNAPAYLLFGFLIYYTLHKKRFFIGYLGFLSHVSVTPALLATFLGFSKPTYKQILLLALGFGLFVLAMNLSVFNHVTNHFGDYTSDSYKKKFGISTFHLVYFVCFILMNLLIFRFNKNAVYNNFYLSVFVIYLVLYFLSPVMSYRFSFYNILYLSLYPYYKSMELDNFLNIVIVFIMFLLFQYGFYSSHDRLHLIG